MSLTDRGKARCSESCTAGLERGVEKRAVLCEKQSHQSDATRSAPTLLKVCAAERGVESSTESREIGGIFLGHPIHLKAKARGEKSMSEKQRTWEGV
jgi:hypothetical protein